MVFGVSRTYRPIGHTNCHPPRPAELFGARGAC
jgi:hypothetical protein